MRDVLTHVGNDRGRIGRLRTVLAMLAVDASSRR